uniref:Uncharacterized protein n=1 Tax=Aegilops tauschii subsp. strangulata TaxID=200361 RepID=A0A453CB20_AEGTS
MGSSSACDGTLSLDEFNASAKALVTKWRGIDVDALPDWEWRPCRKMGVPSEVKCSTDLTSSSLCYLFCYFLCHCARFRTVNKR